MAPEASPEIEAVLGLAGGETALSRKQVEDLAARYLALRAGWQPADSVFLNKIFAREPKLAEAILLFRDELATSVEGAFLYYVANTERERLTSLIDPQASSLAQAYAAKHGVVLDQDHLPQDANDLASLRDSLLHVNAERYGRTDPIPTTVFRFVDERYDRRNAMWMAEMAALAYKEADFVRGQLGEWGYDGPVEWIDKKGSQVFVAENDSRMIVSFRGTAGLRDITTDLGVLTVPADTIGRVHGGFKTALDDVWSQVLEAVKSRQGDRKLFVTGHSLGAALAQLAALRLERANHPATAVYLFGSPLVGDADFVAGYDTALGDRTFSYINHRDVVTGIPPWWLGFSRVATNATWKFMDDKHRLEPLDSEALIVDDPRPEGVVESNGEIIVTPDVQALIDERFANALLAVDPRAIPVGSYARPADSGPVSDHQIHEYVFKMGCAILDGMWDEEGIEPAPDADQAASEASPDG